MSYKCPLCQQEVSKLLYEKITGIWKEKERLLDDLKAKEKKMQQKFNIEKKKLAIEAKESAQLDLKKQQLEFKQERKLIENNYKKQLLIEVGRLKKQEKMNEKQLIKNLKVEFNKEAEIKFSKKKSELERRDRLMTNRYSQLNKQFISLQDKNRRELEKKDCKIKSLTEQIDKSQTPQVLGLLEEDKFVDELVRQYPNDEIQHPGKCGDVVHRIVENGNEVGMIVYELKKVTSGFKQDHVNQTYDAKQERNADYAILVTNAKPPKTKAFGFFISKGIIVIHPAGVFVLIELLREHMIVISRLKLTKEKRNTMINAVLEYIQSPDFKNGIDGIIQDTIELYGSLKKEVKSHIENWELRIGKYRNIKSLANNVKNKAVNLLLDEKGTKLIGEGSNLSSIELPSKID
jgi:hypothetical protein